MSRGSLHTHVAGFTLFEVLAAVALLAFWYVVLSNVAMQGLQSESLNQRRLEASLLADLHLADFEADIAQGRPPPLGENESEEEPFYIDVRVEGMDLAALAASQGHSLEPELASLLGGGSQSQPARLRSIDVVVSWFERGEEHSVSRTTFAFDGSGLEALLAANAAAGGAGNSQEDALKALKEILGQ